MFTGVKALWDKGNSPPRRPSSQAAIKGSMASQKEVHGFFRLSCTECGMQVQGPPRAERDAVHGDDGAAAGGRGGSADAPPGPRVPCALDAQPQLCGTLGRWHPEQRLHASCINLSMQGRTDNHTNGTAAGGERAYSMLSETRPSLLLEYRQRYQDLHQSKPVSCRKLERAAAEEHVSGDMAPRQRIPAGDRAALAQCGSQQT